MINLSEFPQFNVCMTELKKTSIDKRDKGSAVYMVDSKLPAVDFDAVKNNYIHDLKLSVTPKSNDALFQKKDGCIVFVEFKNGHLDRKIQYEIRKKIYDSTLIFTDIVSEGIGALRKAAEYILVYNEEENPKIHEDKKNCIQHAPSFDFLAKNISKYAKEEYVAYGLDIFKNFLFKDVHTYTVDEFNHYLADLQTTGE